MQIIIETKQKSLQFVSLIIEKSFKRKYNEPQKEMAFKWYYFVECTNFNIEEMSSILEYTLYIY